MSRVESERIIRNLVGGDTPPDQGILIRREGKWVFSRSGTVPPGGSEGQVLMKVSDDDFDMEWVDLE